MIYFDNNATTRLSDGVKQCIIDSMDLYYNPSSLYSEGQYVKERIESARNNVAQLIGADAKNIIFTGCATESNNTVISTCIDSSSLSKKHIVVSSVEHSAILEAVKHYEKLGCIELTILPVDSLGRIRLDDVKAAIKDNTILVSIMLVNNEVGNIYPIKEFVEEVKKINPLTKFHTDATQAIGKYKVDIKELNVDSLTLSGHKFHALKGIGALYIKTINNFKPFMYGGHQENGRRAGTENTLGILTMGQAAKEVIESLDADIKLMADLRDYLEKQLTKLNVGVNSGRYSFLGDLEHRVCNTSCILIDGFDGRLVCTTVDTDGETDDSSISSGSACNSGDLEASHVMHAMGIKQIPIRVSFDRYNTLDEVRIFIRKLQKALNKLKNQGANT